MDIKLKNIIKQWYLKIIAYVITGCCIMAGILWIERNADQINMQTLTVDRYEDSWQFWAQMRHFIGAAVDLSSMSNDRKEIAAGKDVDQSQVEERMEEYYNLWMSMGSQHTFTLDVYGNEETLYNAVSEADTEEEVLPENYKECSRFMELNPHLEEQVREYFIYQQLENYDIAVNTIENSEYIYAVGNTEQEIKELKSQYSQMPLYGIYWRNGIVPEEASHMSAAIEEIMADEIGIDFKGALFVGVPKDVYEKNTLLWTKDKAVTEDFFKVFLCFILAAAFAVIYLLLVTGKRPLEEGVHLYYPLDFIWTEVQIAAGFLAVFAVVFLTEFFLFNDSQWLVQTCGVGITLSVLLILILILSQVRRLKARKFLEGFICFRIARKICKTCFSIISGLWKKGRISRQAFFLAVFLPILCATWIGTPFVMGFLIFMIYKYVGDFTEICEGTQRIKGGELTYKIQVKNNDSKLGMLAGDINEISQGLENAVANELRSERLKSELISNVSHDLKTPLTSIVTYVDLLKQEEIENDTARDYISVIDRKAQRLTVLTSDLFEAAKASSGDMPVNLERVDLNAIIRQALGEFDEKINQAELEIRLKLLEKPAYIRADGRLTWRVLDNLLNNVVKYGLAKSRVYIEVSEDGSGIVFTMKNISAYELNIDADELMERFKRGDESRNSEGSGLGLNIANSLVNLQHGRFEILIDGDLFKVSMWLPRHEENE